MATDRELLQMALDALELTGVEYLTQKEIEHLDALEIALRARLAQPEQEPVAFYVYKPTLPIGNLGNVSDGDLPWIYDQDPSSGYSARMLVYTAPPQREWQGLTDEEIGEIADDENYGYMDVARAIQAKLKEKNYD